MAATEAHPTGAGRISHSLEHTERKQMRRQRSSSEQRDRPRVTCRSPNRVKARPADPAVLNSIIESFHTLPSPPLIAASGHFVTTTDLPLRPQSTTPPVASSLSHARSASPASSAEAGARTSFTNAPDVALPPTIRTSRPPSGLSQHAAQRPLSFASVSSSLHYQPEARSSLGSRTHSLTAATYHQADDAKENAANASVPLKGDHMGGESIESQSRSRRRSLRRVEHQETLRPAKTRIELVPPAIGEDAETSRRVSRAEQIIAKATPPAPSKTSMNSRRRIYLPDTSSTDDQLSSESVTSMIEEPGYFGRSRSSTTDVAEQDQRSSGRDSPMRSPIVDSIPTRTSSLRQSGSPASSRRREKKSKQQSESSQRVDSKTDAFFVRETKHIPEDKWADLGDDDGTVKRIRQLQEQRKSRLLEVYPPAPEDGLSNALVAALRAEDSASSLELHAPHVDQRRSSEPSIQRYTERTPRSTRQHAKAESQYGKTPPQARKVLGIPADAQITKLNGARGSDDRAVMKASETVQSARHSVDQGALNVSLAPIPPSASPTPSLRLDYSYVDVVTALQGAEREHETRSSIDPTRPDRSSMQLRHVDEIPLQTPSAVAAQGPQRSGSQKNHKKASPRPIRHPDIPLDFVKRKSRRKSTSDARHGKTGDLDLDTLPRRDSIEIAVVDFLQNERLSRKIRHPQSGRIISYSDVGDPQGAVVFVCLGMGLTRYVTAFYDELATTLRLRLITIDRPGVGQSDPYPPNDRSGPLSWPDDVLVICQNLGIGKFSLLAHSAGAIYALATALILPHLIEGKVHLLGPWIPPSQLEAISRTPNSAVQARALPRSQRFLRILPTPFLKAANSSFMTATSASLKPAARRTPSVTKTDTRRQDNLSPARGSPGERPATQDGRMPDDHGLESLMLMDQYMPEVGMMENFPMGGSEKHPEPPRRTSVILSATAGPMDPSLEYAAAALNAAEHAEKERKAEFTSRLTARTWELATRDSNPATDLLVCLERHRDVGFRYTDVTRPVVITHGSDDKRVPVANVRWLAEQMNRKTISAEPLQSGDGARNEKLFGGCEVRVLQNEGHGLMASPLIMGDILTEIAGYWTGAGKGRMTF